VIGKHIGHYEILERLGAGGMGEVYRARDSRLGRSVAVKVLLGEAVRDRERVQRFLSEARTVSRLNHPNILTLHEIGESDSGPFLVSEFVEGRTVRQMLSFGPLPREQAIDIALQAASGLGRAHEESVVHRDIKPENLMVTHDGFVKILDFGLAKLLFPEGSATGLDLSLTKTGSIVGTPAYLPPEHLEGRPANASSDLYALGLVLYETLTGSNPFRRESVAATLTAILREPMPPLEERLPACPRELEVFIRKATAKDPANRFGSTQEFATALRELQPRVRTPTPGATARPVAAKRTLRRVSIGVAAAGAVALLWVLLKSLPEPARENGGAAKLVMPATTLPKPPGTFPFPPAPGLRLPEGKTGVAVLPIQDDSGDPELAARGIGRILSDAFANILVDIPGVYVISPHRLESIARSQNSSLANASRDLALAREIGKQAMAGVLLSGTLSKIGGTYTLSATLTDTANDIVLDNFLAQSESAERLLMDVTDGVKRGIWQKFAASTPGAASGPGATRSVEDVATRSVDAYDHYMRGAKFIVEGDWETAIPQLEKAVEIDPEMALAWSSLSCAHSFAGDDAKARAAHRKAKEFERHLNEMERRWIELDGIWVNTQNAQTYLETMQNYMKDFPDDRDAYFYAGLAEEHLNSDPAAAISWFEKAYGMVPTYYPVTKALVDCLLKLDRRDEAVAILERYLAHPWLEAHGKEQAQRRLAEIQGKA
jgi:tetratricopeptide (TPR) repeat protein